MSEPQVWIECDDMERAIKKAKIELLNWFIKCTGDSYTMAGLRTVVWNKLKEVEGKVDKA